jgi:transposase
LAPGAPNTVLPHFWCSEVDVWALGGHLRRTQRKARSPPLPRRLLPLIPADLAVVDVSSAPDRTTIVATPKAPSAACPACGNLSTRVHSRYQRVLADLPWQGHAVALRIRARRFRCPEPACSRRIFTERLPAAAPRQRRTGRLAVIQRCIGLGMGGEPGSRLAARLAMPVSGDTLLRLIRAATLDPPPPPRIVGLDDWAWRRGRRYGTLVVDLERNRPIELLPDRQADTVAAWLKAHPGIALVARDRAGAYADGTRAGAPEAVQVADRWHLLRNLGDALQRILDRHPQDLRAAAKAAVAAPSAANETLPPPPSPARPVSPQRQAALARHAARQALFEEIAALHAQGWSQSRIAQATGLDRKTLRRWLRLGRPPTWQQPRHGSAVERHADHLRRRWDEGCRNATQLWREIQALGYAGRPGTVRDWLRRRRLRATSSAASMARWKTPSGRRAAWLVVADAEKPDATERRFAEALLAGPVALVEVIELAREFRRMVRERQPERLDGWLGAAASTALRGFADSLRRDLAAVRAALTEPWSTSPVEGQISRLKMIKRQMYGRAGFDLLRQRVLLAA